MGSVWHYVPILGTLHYLKSVVITMLEFQVLTSVSFFNEVRTFLWTVGISAHIQALTKPQSIVLSSFSFWTNVFLESFVILIFYLIVKFIIV